MSGLLARVPFPVQPWLTVVQLRTRLAQAERALDHPFDRRRSLDLDRAVLGYELARRPQRGHRRAPRDARGLALMLFARDGVVATPGGRAPCPACEEQLLAKCGELRVWHWSHRANDCDPWSEPETPWHRSWKRRFVEAPRRCGESARAQVEVIRGPHRAEIQTAAGLVVELQHSAIDPATIRERERFWAPMVWLVDLTTCRGFELRAHNADGSPRSGWAGFRWKHHRRTWLGARAPVYVDLGDGVFRVHRFGEEDGRGFGWGVPMTAEAFVTRVLTVGAAPLGRTA